MATVRITRDRPHISCASRCGAPVQSGLKRPLTPGVADGIKGGKRHRRWKLAKVNFPIANEIHET